MEVPSFSSLSDFSAIANTLDQLSHTESKTGIDNQNRTINPDNLASFLHSSVQRNHLELKISDDSLKKIAHYACSRFNEWKNATSDIVLHTTLTNLDLTLRWHVKTQTLLIEDIARFDEEGSQKKYFAWIDTNGVMLASGLTDLTKYSDEAKEFLKKRLRCEEEILKELKGNPYIVEYYATIQKINSVSILTKFCSHADYIIYYKKMNSRVPERNKLQIINDTLQGLVYLQKMGIAHRDIKLDNIFIKASETFKDGVRACIGDVGHSFKVSKLHEEIALAACGTTEYKPPELFRLTHEELFNLYKQYFSEIDMWSFGICVEGINTANFPSWSIALRTSADHYTTIRNGHNKEIGRMIARANFPDSHRSSLAKNMSKFSLTILRYLPEFTTTCKNDVKVKINRPHASEALKQFKEIFKDDMKTLEP